MPLLLGRGVVGLILLAFWIWAVLDVIATDESLIRHLPKLAWLMLVVLLSGVGALAWVLLGRPAGAGWRPGDTTPRPVRRTHGPEDSPRRELRAGGPGADDPARRERYAELDAELDRRLEEKRREEQRLQEWEADLRRREADLRATDEEGPPTP